MTWNEVRDSIKFRVNKEKFDSGSFRDVYKISSSHTKFSYVDVYLGEVRGETEFVTIERMIKVQKVYY